MQVALLLEWGAPLELLHRDGLAALHMAARTGKLRVLEVGNASCEGGQGPRSAPVAPVLWPQVCSCGMQGSMPMPMPMPMPSLGPL